MNDEQAAIYASNLIMAFGELYNDTSGYVHDPAAHNLCSAVVVGYTAGRPTFERHYLSYSSPKALPVSLQQKYQPILIPPNNPHGSLYDGAGMAYLHTEVRLLNFLWVNRGNPQIMPTPGQIYFFSTRSVCGSCARHIGEAQAAFSQLAVGLVPLELQAENFRGDARDARQVYLYLAQRGTGGQRRLDSTLVGNVA